MVENKTIEDVLLNAFSDSKVIVEGDGYHYHVTVVSNVFLGMRKIARQQEVYKALSAFINDGSLHAVTMKTLTLDEQEGS